MSKVGELRFIMRGGKRILQQAAICTDLDSPQLGTIEWRDVPLVADPEEDSLATKLLEGDDSVDMGWVDDL